MRSHSSGRETDADLANRSQDAYKKNVDTLFKSLDRAEEELSKSSGPYYHGENVTEADVRLFTVKLSL